MKIRLQELAGMQNSIESLVKLSVPASAAFRFGRLAREIRNYLQDLEVERRKLIEKYGVKNDEDGKINVDEKKKEDFMKEWIELISEEVEVDFEPVSIDLLGDQKISISDMAELSIFFRENATELVNV